MARHEYLVLARAKPGREVELEEWYDKQHLQDVLRVPGVVSGRRYRVVNIISPSDTPAWLTYAVYELEADDPETVLAEIRRRAQTPEMPLSDALETSDLFQVVATDVATKSQKL